jgi:Ala-tRNA(Pro) deacylase
MNLDEYLKERQVPFERLEHPTTYTANGIARLLHIPGKEVAKTILLRVDDHHALVVLPATHQVDLERVKHDLSAQHVALASEEEMARLFPDCEPGAIPPFGSLYHLTTLVDEALAEDEEIVFEGQNHHEAIRMAYRDFEKQEHPRLGHFSTTHLHELVQHYTERLVKRIRRQLPERLRQRVDPEDVAQSVYRSLFRRLKDEPRAFEDSQRIWRLLTVLTYQHVRSLVKFHQDARRDVRRERPGGTLERKYSDPEPGPDEVASLDDLVDHFVKELPEKQREMVMLRLQGADVDDIAKHCNCARSTVQRALARVQQSLRQELDVAR